MGRKGIGARSEPTQWLVQTNGIHLNVAEQGEGPLVFPCQGFPESWYFWRHHPPQFTKPQPNQRKPSRAQATAALLTRPIAPFRLTLVCPP